MPDYVLRLWDGKSFDFDQIPFTKDAIRNRKWAFAADYIRLHALYTEGGVYLDSDVRVLRPFDDLLGRGFVGGIEIVPEMYEQNRHQLDDLHKPINRDLRFHGIGINAAIMASRQGHPFLGDCLKKYRSMNFGESPNSKNLNDLVIGSYISKEAEKYGFAYNDAKQELSNDMLILPSNVFVGNTQYLDEKSYAIHLCNGSWHNRESKFEKIIFKARNHLPACHRLIWCATKMFRKISRLFNTSPNDQNG